MGFAINRNNFNAGLLTPLMDGRTDLQKYVEGCRMLENFILTPYGGVRKRGGFEFINPCVSDGKKSRVIPFEVSRDRSYIVELAEGKIRFFRNGGRVLDGGGSPVEIDSPYLEGDLDAIQFAQINDVMFMVHRDHHPRRLSRLADANWTLTEENFQDAPFLDENLNETVTVTATNTTGALTGLTASAPIFKPEHVGSVWGIAHERQSGDFEVSVSFNNTGSSGVLRVQGTWAIITTGTWAGTLKLQRRKIGATAWEDYRTYSAASDRNIAPSETVDDLMEYRLNFVRSSGSGSATLEARTLYVRGVVKITHYNSPTSVIVDVQRPLYATTATYRWSEAAWSKVNGYPGAICFFEGRVFYAGTYREPQAGWASAGDNYTRFIKGTLDTDSFKFVLNATELNAILWMVADRRLVIGTSGGEWILDSRTNGGALTASTAVPKPQSAIGSDPVQARLVNSSVMFVDYGGRRLFDFNYDYNFDKYKEGDLTLVGEQVTKGGILGMSYMRRPDPIVWAWTRDGDLLGFTYMPKQSVAGWHPHPVGGHVESCAVIRGEGPADELWITVRRTINGQTKRYIERMFPTAKEVQESENAADFFYVDSGRTFEGSGVDQVTITGDVPAPWKMPLTPGPSANPSVTIYKSWTTPTPPATGYRAQLTVTDQGYDSYSFVWSVFNAAVPVGIWTADGSSPDINAAGPWNRQLGPVGGPPVFHHDTGNLAELTGMGHLEGQTVAILADGFLLADAKVIAGKVSLGGRRYRKVTCGLRVRSVLQPMTIENAGPSGTSRFKRARVIKVVVNFWKTLGGRVGQEPDEPNMDSVRFRENSVPFGTPTPVFTGEKEIVFDKGYTRTPRACVVHDDPFPCSVLSMNAFINYERS